MRSIHSLLRPYLLYHVIHAVKDSGFDDVFLDDLGKGFIRAAPHDIDVADAVHVEYGFRMPVVLLGLSIVVQQKHDRFSDPAPILVEDAAEQAVAYGLYTKLVIR